MKMKDFFSKKRLSYKRLKPILRTVCFMNYDVSVIPTAPFQFSKGTRKGGIIKQIIWPKK